MTLPNDKVVAETRFLTLELRAEKSAGEKYLQGIAASYGVLSENLGGFRERLTYGCFEDSLRKTDIKMFHAHDSGRTLGSTRAGTLILADSPSGLKFKCLLPASASDVFESVERGDVRGMSFGFRVRRDSWAAEDDPEDGQRSIDVRRVLEANLFEISCVPVPAYPVVDAVGALTRNYFPEGLPASMPTEIRSRVTTGIEQPISDDEWLQRARLRVRSAQLL